MKDTTQVYLETLLAKLHIIQTIQDDFKFAKELSLFACDEIPKLIKMVVALEKELEMRKMGDA